MEKLLFVINPISGGVDKSGLRDEIEACCQGGDMDFSIIETQGEDDFTLIVDELKRLSPDIVVACGGDGTINLVAQVLIKQNLKDIKLAILPLGSANGLATELDIPENTQQAIGIMNHGDILEMDILQINNEHLSLHLSDIGFNAKLIKRFEASGSRGKLGYARQFFATLFKRKPHKYTFEINGNHFSQRAGMVVFANATQYGTGAVVNPDGKLDDGKFEVCIFKPYPWYAIFTITYHFFSGKMKRSRYVKIIEARELTLTTKKEDSLQIDGETIGDFNKVYVKLLPGILKVLVPQSSGSNK